MVVPRARVFVLQRSRLLHHDATAGFQINKKVKYGPLVIHVKNMLEWLWKTGVLDESVMLFCPDCGAAERVG